MSLMNNRAGSIPSRQQGFTLIEVLVAVVVLAIGVLGLAGLQATAVRSNSSAYMRSQATVLAYDIADRMRVNRQAALNAAYYLCNADDESAGCTGLAKQDVQTWRAALANTLPSGTGTIARGAGNAFTITIQWDDNRDLTDLQQFSMVTEL